MASVFITREVLLGLAAVHEARDSTGPLSIVHRDVTPSNIYLSRDGEVKLGDFGIARSLARAPEVLALGGEAAASDASLMGKFSYLAPEQVAGEPFDNRADLFSTATVFAELLIGKPLFPGTGQLQVLLAIRDCNLAPLREAGSRLPPGLVAVVEKALSRDPGQRFKNAALFAEALRPFSGDATIARKAVAVRVIAVQTVPSDAHLAAVRESARALRAAAPVPHAEPSSPEVELEFGEVMLDAGESFDTEDDLRVSETGQYPEMRSYIESEGKRIGPWPFVRLIDALASGELKATDRVDYLGQGWRPITDIPELFKVLPKEAPAPPAPPRVDAAYRANLAETTMLDVLAHVLVAQQSGLLVLDGPAPGDISSQRREVYFLCGRLHHVASTNAGERLGEFLIRRGKLSRDELDMALAVLPRYGGRIGDTLIGLGLVDGVDIFRAIREQAQGRVTEAFLWPEGSAEFFPDAEMPAVEFPLDLDVPTLMLAGMEVSHPGASPMAFLEPQIDAMVIPSSRPELAGFAFPPVVTIVRTVLARPMSIRELLGLVARSGAATGPDVARALEVLLALGLARWE
jgi:serine/threonine-protein kinase